MTFIINSWKGNNALWKVWLLGYPLTFVFLAIGLIISQEFKVSLGASITVGSLLYIWLLVSIWRCSKNTKSKFWFNANRGLVILTIIMATIMLALQTSL